jgi:hypothetical protein
MRCNEPNGEFFPRLHASMGKLIPHAGITGLVCVEFEEHHNLCTLVRKNRARSFRQESEISL